MPVYHKQYKADPIPNRELKVDRFVDTETTSDIVVINLSEAHDFAPEYPRKTTLTLSYTEAMALKHVFTHMKDYIAEETDFTSTTLPRTIGYVNFNRRTKQHEIQCTCGEAQPYHPDSENRLSKRTKQPIIQCHACHRYLDLTQETRHEPDWTPEPEEA